VLWTKIELDRKNPEEEENGEGHPRTHQGSSHQEKKSPKTQEDGQENPPFRKERNVKMANINTDGVDDQDGNEGKAKGSAHVRLKGVNLLIIVGPPPTAQSDWPLHKSG
jgi:hypothetical protein